MNLVNDQFTRIAPGTYALKVSGALTLQWDLDGTGFSDFTGSAFTAAGDVIIELPDCLIKVTLAGANTALFKLITS